MKSGWRTSTLGEVCDLINRGIAPAYVETGECLVLNQKCVRDHAVNFALGRRHDTAKKRVPADRFVQAGDGLINSTGTGTLGRVAQIRGTPPEHTTVDTHVTIVRPKVDIFHPDYFGYALQLIEGDLEVSGEGASGQTELSRQVIASKEIRFPISKDEQRRIVAILDEAFEAIATATANAEKNLGNARSIFDWSLNSVFLSRGKNWIEEPLSQHVKFIDYRGKTPLKSQAGVRLITAKNVKMGFIQRTPEEFVDQKTYLAWMTRGFPQKGDVLFTTEAPLGNVAQLDTDETVAIGQRLITMQPEAGVLDRAFLKYMLLSKPLQDQILRRGTGATVQGIKARLLKQIPIIYPRNYSEQLSIVAKLDNLLGQVMRLENICRDKKRTLVELKQSLLRNAFSGELVSSSRSILEAAAE